ncbi:MAG: acyltransferase [Candidatus Eremiobacteraeota bacterium]|nr:acyltransferase [Candidatus Eremiobacteraeota bacterium]MBC5826608.1 acyltransferase [Candidatus Eremiobacteraeota bacterium]
MKRPQDRLWKGLAALAGLGAVASAAPFRKRLRSAVRMARSLGDELPDLNDPIFIDYLLNTFVGKIPFPEIRMDLYRKAGLKVDPTTNIMMHAFVLQARDISIGPNCIIGPFTTLDGRATLAIGRNVNVAGQVLTIGGHHAVDSPTAEGLLGKVVIEDNAWIAMRATILPGVTVGEGAYVAAGALVNRNVEPYTLVGGVPAKKIRDRNRDIKYTLGHFPRWI